MFDYSRAAIGKVLRDLRSLAFWFSVTVQLLGIGYLVYALAVKAGFPVANYLLISISSLYLIFFVATAKKKDKDFLRGKRITARVCKWARLAVKAYTLGVTVYGVYVATEHFTPISALFMTASALGWIVQVAIEVIINYAENKVQLIFKGIETDMKQIVKPVTSTVNFVKRITGNEVKEEEPPSKKRLLLDKLVKEQKERRLKIKEEEKFKESQIKKEKAAEKNQNRLPIFRIKGILKKQNKKNQILSPVQSKEYAVK